VLNQHHGLGPLGKVDSIARVRIECRAGIREGRSRVVISGNFRGPVALLSTALFFCLLCGMVTRAWAQGGGGNVSSNTCYTEDVLAGPGTSFSVGVYVDNSDTLVGMQIPVYYKSDDVNLICDSVSFAGSRCRGFSVQFFKIDPDGGIVFLAMLNTGASSDLPGALYPGKGKVATLWFTAPAKSGVGTVVLQSGPDVRFPHERINYGYLFWKPSAAQVDCRYEAGNITLK
jgi:hypothetical protein